MIGIRTNQPSRTTDSDTLLQASRRLDWRFLLPDPELKRVAYVGPTRGPLLESLGLFAGSLDVWESPGPDAATRREGEQPYDVVVAHMPDGAALQWAAALSGPGSCLYVEGHGLLGSGGKRLAKSVWGSVRQARLWSLGECVRKMRQLGMGDIAAYWMWPDLDHCTKIVPVDDPLPLLSLQMSHLAHPALHSVLHSAAAQRLAEGLMQAAAPAFGVVATASQAASGATGIKASV